MIRLGIFRFRFSTIPISRPEKGVKNSDDLINFADNALYKAKEKGRDLIISHVSL